MALSQSKLSAQLQKLNDKNNPQFAGWPSTALVAAQNWTNAYDAYALDATDAFGNGIVLANKSLFLSGISAWAPGATPASAAAMFGAAWSAYWMGAQLQFTAFPPAYAAAVSNVVVAAVPAPLIASLTAAFGAPQSSAAAAADALAAAFHTATLTVATLLSGTTSVPAPISTPGVLS